jgi:hypothetical protein
MSKSYILSTKLHQRLRMHLPLEIRPASALWQWQA